jgi:hypothetical protein
VTSVIRSSRTLALTAAVTAILGTACDGGAHGAASHDAQPVDAASAAPRSSAVEPSSAPVAAAPTSSTTTVAPGTRAEQSTATPANATTLAPPDPAPAPAPGNGSTAAEPRTQFVTAFGVRLTVPADWPVYDLATDAGRCVRTDRHAVYLGHAGPSQECPTQVVGRVGTVQIEPLDALAPPGVGLATASSEVNGVAARRDPAADTTHAVVAVLPTDRVVVTVTFETDGGRADQILQTLERVATPNGDTGTQAQDQPVSCAALGCPGNPGVVYTGLGFDACAAPTTSQMSAWLASPFRSIGIYIGGANRGCSQPNLSASWVSTVLGQGWKLVPIYVGLQAPCASISAAKIDPAIAGAQGTAAAVDAMNRAAALGIGAQRPLVFDMEAYNNADVGCVAAVRAFVSGWAGQLHQGGYLAGFYSSAASGIADQSAIASNPAYNHLDLIWFAHWNNDPSVNEPTKAWLPDNLWTDHQRMHQYRGGQQETFGGVTINIDRDYVDAQVVG